MRVALLLCCLAGLVPLGLVGAGAFNYAEVSPRTVSVTLATDADAYLALSANAASPHDCFVTVSAGGKASVSFDAVDAGCSAGTGAGIAQGDGSTGSKYSRYAFHDILKVTNKGTRPLLLWANASTTSGGSSLVEVAKRSAAGAMSDGDYVTSSATPLDPLTVGSTAYLGIRVKSGTLTSGNDVLGTITIEARRSS